MKLISEFNVMLNIDGRLWEIDVETFKTTHRVNVRQAGWAMWHDTYILRGKDYKLDPVQYAVQMIQNENK